MRKTLLIGATIIAAAVTALTVAPTAYAVVHCPPDAQTPFVSSGIAAGWGSTSCDLTAYNLAMHVYLQNYEGVFGWIDIYEASDNRSGTYGYSLLATDPYGCGGLYRVRVYATWNNGGPGSDVGPSASLC